MIFTKNARLSRNLALVAGVATLAVVAIAMDAHAGTATSAFDTIYSTTKDWLQSGLGRLVSLAAVGYGLGAGLFRNSVTGAVTGVGGGMVMYAAPSLVEGALTAVVPTAAAHAHLPAAVLAAMM